MRRLFTAAAVAALALPAAAFAQVENAPAFATAPTPAVVATTAAPTSTAPTTMVRADVAGIQQHDAADTHSVNAVAAAGGLHQGQGMALMVVGGAAVLGGLLIGNNAGDAIAVGGLVVGLYGLYQYVR